MDHSVLFYISISLILFGMGMLTISMWLQHSTRITMDKDVHSFSKRFIKISFALFFVGIIFFIINSVL